MFDENADPDLVAQCEWIGRFCALAVGTLGAAILTGWMLDVGALETLIPGWISTKPDTALAFVLAGAALAAAGRSQEGPHWRRTHLALAAAVLVLGLATLVGHLLAIDLGIDRLLVANPGAAGGLAPPVRMTPATAAAFAITGFALVLLDCRQRVLSEVAALVSGLIGVMALLGYAYGVTALHDVGAAHGMALPTAAALVTIDLGVLLARPRRGLMGIIISRTAGGVMLRRLLPLALGAPLAIGWLRIRGEHLGFISSEVGVALVALAYVVLFTAFIWHTAGVLHQSDQRRFAAERSRRQQQAQLAGIIDSAMDAIVMVDAAQRVMLFNPAAEQMFGRKAAEVLGGPLDVLLPQHQRSEHARRMRAFGASATTSRRLGEAAGLSGMRANGETFPIEASISRLEANGDPYFTAILRDVTERTRAQEALRKSEQRERIRFEELTKLLDAVPAAVWFAHDPQADVITGNRLAYQWLAMPEGDNLSVSAPGAASQHEVMLLKDGVELAPAQMPLQRAAAGTELRNYEFELRTRDGTSRHLLGNATPLLDEGGRSRGAVSAFIDITARRAAELATQAAKAEAERANNAKSRFLAAASHDLRQPLSALSLYVNILKTHVDPAGEPLVENLKDCVGSLSALLTDLLDLSKLEAGVVRPNPTDFPIADTLFSLMSIHGPEARAHRLRLRHVVSGATARTDPVLYKRILGNLIDNAIRYTDRGGVLVGCRRRQGRMWVEVWDTGIGIPQDKIAEIFEEFRQLGDEARTRGSGLGLAIVAKAAALLGLEISVRSRPGRGSVFAVELPLGVAAAIPAPEPSQLAYRSLRIALVEDNIMVREALVHALLDAGHEVVAAATGAALRAELGDLPPDIVVSDYRLAHGETGFDVVTAVRAAMGAKLPAILITGDTDPKLMRGMADRGIVVLHKPIDLELLQAHLEDLTWRDETATP